MIDSFDGSVFYKLSDWLFGRVLTFLFIYVCVRIDQNNNILFHKGPLFKNWKSLFEIFSVQVGSIEFCEVWLHSSLLSTVLI